MVKTIESISTFECFLGFVLGGGGALEPRFSSVFEEENKLSSTPPSIRLYLPTDFCDALDRLDPSEETDRWLGSGCL